MSGSVRDPETVREPAPCDAERRILRALYQLEQDWGAGTFDYGRIRRILTGECQDCKDGHAEGIIRRVG